MTLNTEESLWEAVRAHQRNGDCESAAKAYDAILRNKLDRMRAAGELDRPKLFGVLVEPGWYHDKRDLTYKHDDGRVVDDRLAVFHRSVEAGYWESVAN